MNYLVLSDYPDFFIIISNLGKHEITISLITRRFDCFFLSFLPYWYSYTRISIYIYIFILICICTSSFLLEVFFYIIITISLLSTVPLKSVPPVWPMGDLFQTKGRTSYS